MSEHFEYLTILTLYLHLLIPQSYDCMFRKELFVGRHSRPIAELQGTGLAMGPGCRARGEEGCPRYRRQMLVHEDPRVPASVLQDE